jgi:phosphoesterase RecJ-like protein
VTNLAETARVLRDADDVLIVSHIRPDGDCVGSTVALLFGLESMGKRVAAYNVSKLNQKLNFLEGADRIRQSLPHWPVRYTVFVDCGGLTRVSDDFVPQGVTINIDHHLTNEVFAEYNYIDPEAASVGEQIYNILECLGVQITSRIAQGVFMSLMTDTGSFRYSNTSAATLELAARMARAGAVPWEIASHYYESRDYGEMMLTGRAFNRMQLEFDGRLAWSELRVTDYDDVGGDDVEPDGLVNEMRQITGVEVSLLIHECRDGGIRAGFRGRGHVDCAAVAAVCGGGGHFNAAGCRIPGVTFEEGRERVLAATRAALGRLRAEG